MSNDRMFHIDGFYVTGQDVARYISAKCPSLKCPACGQDGIAVAANGADEPAHVIARQGDDHYSALNHSSYGAFCIHCGYAWMFWAEMVEKWVREQRGLENTDG